MLSVFNYGTKLVLNDSYIFEIHYGEYFNDLYWYLDPPFFNINSIDFFHRDYIDYLLNALNRGQKVLLKRSL